MDTQLRQGLREFLLVHPFIRRLFREEGLRKLQVVYVYGRLNDKNELEIPPSLDFEGVFQVNQKWITARSDNFPIYRGDIESLVDIRQFLLWIQQNNLADGLKIEPLTILYQDKDVRKALKR